MKKTDEARNIGRRGSVSGRKDPEPLDDAFQDQLGRTFTDPDDSSPHDEPPYDQPAYAGRPDPDDLSPEAVLALFDSPGPGSRKKNGPGNGRRAIPQEEIFDFFGFRKGRKRKIERILSELTSQGRLIRLKGPTYALPERLSRVAGRISIRRQGMGFVRPETGTGGRSASSGRNLGRATDGGRAKSSSPARGRNRASEEIYVHPSQLGGAWDGDRVLVALLPGQSGKNPEGRVIEVLERSLKEAAVVLLPEMVREDGRSKRLARPLDARLSGYLLVDLSDLSSRVSADETVLVALLPESGQPGDGVIRARAVTVLGAQKSLPLHERLVKAAHGIHTTFPPEVLEECALLPDEPDPDEFFPQGGSPAELQELAASDFSGSSGFAALSFGDREAVTAASQLQDEPSQTEAPFASTAASLRGKAAGQIPKTARRRYLRQLGFVTIDGEDAKDFDDAIHVERAASGYLLRVAIADVAHYVRPGSALDREALERGNSCYFPASVEPMLPEALSNGLCSLKPHTPRLAMVAEIAFDGAGEPGKSAFYPAVIESAGRLTYTQVHKALELEDETARSELREHLPMLAQASGLARLLMRKRGSRGSLDFDLPEPKVLLNEKGEVQALQFSQRHFSNRLIEEFMIAANEAVARHLENLGASFLYRAHPAPDPDKLADFFTTLERNGLLTEQPRKPGAGEFGHSAGASPELSSARSFGGRRGISEQPWKRNGGRNSRSSSGAAKSSYGAGHKSVQVSRGEQSGVRGPSAADLQKILERVSGTAEEYVVNRLLLRSMMQARYTPEQEGHFGLASEAYCHFTSPIRRYADLVVHRVLRRSLGLGDRLPAREQLFGIADSLNESERNAIDAEREIQKISAALFLSDQVGEEFEATVAGMSSFGLFVELKSMPAEGFLPVEELEDDFYRLDSERQMLIGLRGGRIYRLGQELRVVLDKADPARQEIRFFLSPESHPEAIGRKGKPLKGPVRGRTERKPAPRGKGGRQREKFKSGAVRVRKK